MAGRPDANAYEMHRSIKSSIVMLTNDIPAIGRCSSLPKKQLV